MSRVVRRCTSLFTMAPLHGKHARFKGGCRQQGGVNGFAFAPRESYISRNAIVTVRPKTGRIKGKTPTNLSLVIAERTLDVSYCSLFTRAELPTACGDAEIACRQGAYRAEYRTDLCVIKRTFALGLG